MSQDDPLDAVKPPAVLSFASDSTGRAGSFEAVPLQQPAREATLHQHTAWKYVLAAVVFGTLGVGMYIVIQYQLNESRLRNWVVPGKKN